MRLTLRTLLAYLDDTLEPSEAKEIGQKVAGSEMAQSLIARIEQLQRAPSLTAPPLAGSGARLDVNTVAEYLDSVLPHELLPEVEDVLLNDDLYLTEIAACHKILTLYLGQPDTMPALARKRMYGLVKPKPEPAERVANRPQPSPQPKAPAPRRELPPPLPDDEDSDELAVPDYLRAARRRRQLATTAMTAGLLLLIALVVWQMWPRHHSGKSLASLIAQTGDSSREELVAPPATKPETKAEKQPDKVTDKTPEKAPDKVTDKAPEKAPDKQPIDKPVVVSANMERRDGIGRQVALGPKDPAVLLRRVPGQEQWQRIGRDGSVATAEMLMSLPGFRSEVQLESGVHISLLGNVPEFSPDFPFVLESRLMLHIPAAGHDADLTMERGRILLTNQKPQGEARLTIRFLEEAWDLVLKDAQSTIAVELWGIHPPDVPFAKDGKGEGPMYFLNVLCLQGQADVARTRYREESLPTSSVYFWNNREGSRAGPQQLKALPKWYTDVKPALTTQPAKDMALAVADLGVRLEKNKAVDVALAEMRKEPKPASRILAIRSLAAIDAIKDLMDILADENDPLGREYANFALRQWIGDRRENELILYQTLYDKMRSYTRLEAEMVLELLHSFSPEARKNPETYEKLIFNLTHRKLAIRQLSHWHLVGLVPDGQAIRYNPAGDKDSLLAAQREWTKRIPTDTAPKTKPAPK